MKAAVPFQTYPKQLKRLQDADDASSTGVKVSVGDDSKTMPGAQEAPVRVCSYESSMAALRGNLTVIARINLPLLDLVWIRRCPNQALLYQMQLAETQRIQNDICWHSLDFRLDYSQERKIKSTPI